MYSTLKDNLPDKQQDLSEIIISKSWHMEAAFVDVWVTGNNLGICVSCSQCFNHSVMWTICLSSLSLLVLKAGIVRSTQTGQCMFKPDNVSALQQAFIAMCWNWIFFFFFKPLKSDSVCVENWRRWKHNCKFICECFNTLHVLFSFFWISVDTSIDPFTFAWIYNEVGEVYTKAVYVENTEYQGCCKKKACESRHQLL